MRNSGTGSATNTILMSSMRCWRRRQPNSWVVIHYPSPLIAAPGAAKTETISPLDGAGGQMRLQLLPVKAHCCRHHQRNNAARMRLVGCCARLGDCGILVIKDFTSILSAARVTRGQVLAAIREIDDLAGMYAMSVVMVVIRSQWRGRMIVVGACTTALDGMRWSRPWVIASS